MSCIGCSFLLPIGAKFCPRCGAKVIYLNEAGASSSSSSGAKPAITAHSHHITTSDGTVALAGRKQPSFSGGSGALPRGGVVALAPITSSDVVSALHPKPATKRGEVIANAIDAMEDEYFDPKQFQAMNLGGGKGRGGGAQMHRAPKDRATSSGSAKGALRPRWRSRDGPIDPAGRLFDASDRNLLCMDVSPNRAECVVGSADHGLKVFEIATCKQKRNLYTKKFGHTEWVTSCKYLPDGRILSGGMDSKLCLWHSSAIRCDDLLAHKGSISKVDCNENGIAVSASYDRTLMLWDCNRGGQCMNVLSGHGKPVMEFVWQSGLIVSGDRGGQLLAWDVETGNRLLELKGGQGQFSALGWLLDNDFDVVLGGTQDGCLRVWDVRSGPDPLLTSQLHPGGAVTGVKASKPFGGSASNVITCGADRKIKVLDPRDSFAVVHTIDHHVDFIYTLETLDDLIISGSGNGSVMVHDAQTAECYFALGAHTSAIRALYATENALITAGDDGKAMVFDF